MTACRVLAAALSLLLTCAPDARAQTASPRRFWRADVAEVYLTLERAHRAHPPAPEIAAEINRDFDRATIQFFTGMNVVETMRQVTNRLRFGDEVTPNQMFASSLRVAATPAVLDLSNPVPATITLDSMYPAQTVGAVTIRVISSSGRKVFEKITTESRGTFPLETSRLSVGAYRVEVLAGEEPQFTARWAVTDESLTAIRDALLEQLDKLDAAPVPALPQALAACRARINLLTDRPTFEDTAQFLADPIALRRELETELETIKKGRDPYVNRRAGYWRVFSFRGADIPCRVFAPPQSAKIPMPLVIALHGAGGDENMWPDGYGAGVLTSLAEQHGFVILSPRTEMLVGNAPVFDTLVDAVAELYPIDRSRVYLIGHSLGAMAATGLMAQRPGKVAAACLIGGLGRFAPGAKLPPTLVISGDLDPLMRAEDVQSGVERARKDGQPVDLKLVKDRGHSLLVGEETPGAITWMLRHRTK